MANLDPRVALEDSDMMKDYRRMLYRLDLATSFRSTDALLHHFMSETTLDGFIEIRVHSMYPSPDAPVSVCPTPSARLSFFRDPSTGEVLADKLFEPARDTSEKSGEALYRQRYTVAKRYPPGTLLPQAFNPIIQPLLKGNRSTLVFEYRAFLLRSTLALDLLDECEVVNRQAPHKLMVGYVGRSERGALSAYQLDDNVARTTFLDMNPMAFHVSTANNDLGRECVIA
ncbi:hypothetical protein FRC10_006538 [Ceratobasidium sp. 414]|nr:hypothetical protein FRC10_006538 [Ceratobasidium sp. 414]